MKEYNLQNDSGSMGFMICSVHWCPLLEPSLLGVFRVFVLSKGLWLPMSQLKIFVVFVQEDTNTIRWVIININKDLCCKFFDIFNLGIVGN